MFFGLRLISFCGTFCFLKSDFWNSKKNSDNSNSLEIFQNHHLQILEPFWFINEEDGKPFNCDQQTYLEMLEDHFFLQLSAREIRKYWFQQDGASSHTAASVIDRLNEIFGNRLISNKGAVKWPPKSPDLAPNDYGFWGQAKQFIYEKQPKTFEELKEALNEFIATLTEEKIRKLTQNIR